MASKKSEKTKTYVVFGLALVLVISIYFRFIHAKTQHDEKQNPALSAATQPLDQFSVPRIRIGEPDDRAPQGHGIDVYLPATLRDIFSPLQQKATALSKAENIDQPKQIPSLRLKGTIVGGKRPIAVINDQFVRMGDRVSGYEVIRIGKKEVLLDSGNRKMTLEILKNE